MLNRPEVTLPVSVLVIVLPLLLSACSTNASDEPASERFEAPAGISPSHVQISPKEQGRKEAQSSHPPASSEESPLKSLNAYIMEGIEQNAELEAAFLSYSAAREKNTIVSTLPDPTLSFGHFLQEIETRAGPQQQRIGIMQPVPWFGTLGLKGDIADAEAEALRFAFLQKKNNLVSRMAEAYFELAFLNQSIVITEANFELLKRWEQVLAQRYRTQAGTQADLIKVQVELGNMEDRLKQLADMRQPLQSQLNALLNRSVESKIQMDDSVLTGPSIFIEDADMMQTEAELRQLLPNQNPELLLQQSLVRARELGIDLALNDYYPDLVFGAEYISVGSEGVAGSNSGEDATVASVSISLPLYWQKYDANLARARKEKSASERSHRSTLFTLQANLSKVLFNLKDSRRRVSLYQHTLVPKAQQSLSSSYTAFEAGKASFLDLLDAERMLLEFELSLARAQTDYHIAAANLAAILGESVPKQKSDSRGDS